MYTGPHLIKDSLVFGYDTGYGVADNKTSTRFYPGEPTTNAVPLSTFINTSNWTGAGWSGTIAVSADYDNTLELTSTNGWRTWRVNTGITSGGTVTVSYEYKMKTLATTNVYMLNLNGDQLGSYVNSLGSISAADTQDLSNWKTFTGTFTANSNSNLAIGLRGADGQALTDTIYVRNLQVELKGQPSPFTATSRSSTQSLIDLTKTTDIDVSNVSFDSTGQPTFDGTNDTIQISDPNVSSSAGFSIEMIIKPSNASSSPMVITPNSGGIDHFVRFNSNGRLYMRMVVAQDSSVQDFTTTTSLSSTDYHYVVFTFKQSEGGKAYYNGSQESAASANFTALDWSSVWKIGQRGNNTFFFDGELPILKVHNQVLSANQVKQNYNAYKNRFDI